MAYGQADTEADEQIEIFGREAEWFSAIEGSRWRLLVQVQTLLNGRALPIWLFRAKITGEWRNGIRAALRTQWP